MFFSCTFLRMEGIRLPVSEAVAMRTGSLLPAFYRNKPFPSNISRFGLSLEAYERMLSKK